MKLLEALDIVNELKTNDAIFCIKPWGLNSDAVIGQLTEEYRVPKEKIDAGFDYFLDAPVAQEVLEGFQNCKLNKDQKRDLLLYYAENDGFPDWAYEMKERIGE